MRYFHSLLIMAAALTLAGCEARIKTLVAKPGIFSDPKRIYIVDSIDPIAGEAISPAFRAGMKDGMARCGIATEDIKLDKLALNQGKQLKADLATFHPDLLMRIETRSISAIQTSETVAYWVGAWDPLRDATHEVWSAQMNTLDFTGTVDRKGRGTELAETVIKQMTADGMLPACARPLPSETGKSQ